MTKKKQTATTNSYEEIEKKLCESNAFTERDKAALHKVISVYRQIEAMGKFGRFILWVLAGLATLTASLNVIFQSVEKWLN